MTQRLNPSELEIDLFCKGIKIHESCALEDDARLFARTRAGLGSGLELIIPGDRKDLWMNIPVEEDFVVASPYFLKKDSDSYYVFDTRNDVRYDVRIPHEPQWYTQHTSKGTMMSRVGVLQGTYLGIYINNSCGYWYSNPSANCQFCTTGYNVGVNEVAQKDVDDVVEVCRAAKEESDVTFVHFNSGYDRGKGLDLTAPYVKAVKERVGALIGVQVIPSKELWKYDKMIDLGVNHFSFCYEFHNPEYFAKLLPGKEQSVGQQAFFDALEYTSAKLGPGRCSGEIIAGVEPLEDTFRAIDYITGVGAFPTVCVFRPVIGSDMEHYPSPTYEDMRAVMKHMYDACKRNGIPVGIQPNIEVSLIVNPDDAKYLADKNLSYYLYEAKLKAYKLAAKPYFWWERRPKTISHSVTLAPPSAPLDLPEETKAAA